MSVCRWCRCSHRFFAHTWWWSSLRPDHLSSSRRTFSTNSNDSSYRLRPDQYSSALHSLTQEDIRNFSIIAHIDHGKSTLSDKLLERAGNISPLKKADAQILDSLKVERERGITVKAQTASMFFRHSTDARTYLLNLIDTPGHVDFSLEVSRSLAACTGALLLVDASQGLQAQSLANFHTAQQAGIDVIPVITKIDLHTADVPRVVQQLQDTLNFSPEQVICLSSKTGVGVEAVFPAIVDRFAPPMGAVERPFRALLFDSRYDHHKGVVCLIHVVDGILNVGDHVATYHENGQYEAIEIGLLMPTPYPCETLRTGQVGYIVFNSMRDPHQAKFGDTFYTLASKKVRGSIGQGLWQSIRENTEPLQGFKPSRPMIYAGLYPVDSSDFEALDDAMQKLALNDPSVHIAKETSLALGLGFRVGFLGLLHADVFVSRLEDEFGVVVLLTAPTVPYTAVMKDGSEQRIDSPAKFAEGPNVDHYLEPFVTASLITPLAYQGALNMLCQSHRGELLEMQPIGSGDRVLLRYELPLNEIVSDFYDSVKSMSSGYASFDYQETAARRAPLVKVDIKINGEPVDALSLILHEDKAEMKARRLVVLLKDAIDRQQIEIIIQAAIGTKVLARERIAPYRKDVLIKSGKVVGGGDVTRKNKLLAKQKEGKKRMKMTGSVELGADVFTTVLKLNK